MSGCERGRRTRCERGTEIHPTNRATTTPTSTSRTNQHQQNHQHEDQHHHQQHAPPGPPPAPWTMANSTGTNNTSTMTTPAQPSSPTQRPAQPAPSSLAAVPPPAPASHAGICSVHVSIYAQDSKFYSYALQNQKKLARRFLYLHMFEMLPLVRYTAHKQICIHKQIARMQALENWKWKRNKALQSIAHNTNMIYIYMNFKSICKKSPNIADTQTDTTPLRATRLKATLVK